MQAVRQCSACARGTVGGLLRSQTEMSQHTSKSVFRKGANCTRFLSSSSSVLLNTRNPVAQVKDAPSSSLASLTYGHGLYAVPLTQQVENLSSESLIRRAVSVVTDSSSTFLSQTSLAFIDVLTDYSKAVHTLITLQRRYLTSLGKLTPAEKDSLQQVISGQKAQVRHNREECKRFESVWINAVNLCKMAAEAAHSSGAEQASITVRTNVQVAQSHVEEARKVSADADKKLAETKVDEIQRMAEYTAFLENTEEHEIHEAYLRED